MPASKTFWNTYINKTNLTAVADNYFMDTSDERTVCSSHSNKSNQEDENLDEVTGDEEIGDRVHLEISSLKKKQMVRLIHKLSESSEHQMKESLAIIREATQKNLNDLVSSMENRINQLEKLRNQPLAPVDDSNCDMINEMNEYLESYLERLSPAK